MMNGGRYEEATDYLDETVALSGASGDRLTSARALSNLGSLALLRQNYETAETLAMQALGFFEQAGNRWGTATHIAMLGEVAAGRGDLAKAERLWRDALAIWLDLGAHAMAYESLLRLAFVAHEQKHGMTSRPACWVWRSGWRKQWKCLWAKMQRSANGAQNHSPRDGLGVRLMQPPPSRWAEPCLQSRPWTPPLVVFRKPVPADAAP